MRLGEFAEAGERAVQPVRRQRWRFADRGGPWIDRELLGQPCGKSARPMGARKPGDGGEQRPVMLERIGHLIIQTLAVLRLDSVDTELDPLTDQHTRAGIAVIVGELDARHGDGKAGRGRQRREPHLGVHLRSPPIADWVVAVAGELHEQFGGQARLGLVIFDVKDQLPTRAASGYFLAHGDPRDAILRAQCTRCVKCLGEKGDTAVVESSGVCRERNPEPVAGDPAVAHQVCSAARISISLAQPYGPG
jgi:hypothetical protein